jgi:hypothetical protein
MGSEMSRQRIFYQERRKAGLCRRCGIPAAIKVNGKRAGQPSAFCPGCLAIERDKKRTEYRTDNGIPLSAPLYKRAKRAAVNGRKKV